MQQTYIICEIYCDGAARGNPGRAGWGAVIEIKEYVTLAQFEGHSPTLAYESNIFERGGYSQNATNNQMELTAALESLLFCGQVKFPKNVVLKKIKIHSDSKYVIEGMKNWRFGWIKNNWKTSQGTEVLNKEIWQKLVAAVESLSVEIDWIHVKGHSGILLNERADKIATEYADNQFFDCYEGLAKNYEPLDAKNRVESPFEGEKKYPYYLCYLNGKLERFLFWSECEKKVKGFRNAKFKKISSLSEETEILARWGIQRE